MKRMTRLLARRRSQPWRRHTSSASVVAGRGLGRHFAPDAGIALIEAVIAIFVFAIVSTALVGLLTSSTSITTLTKDRTIAEQGVSNQIELIRSMDYNLVGTTTGNPSGNIQSAVAFAGLNGESLGVPATMTTKITFAGANVPGAAVTGADYKKVVVTITRQDGKVLAQAVTYLAPKTQASQTTGTVQATVVDIGNNTSQTGTALQNVRVTLTPPPGLNPPIPPGPESDTTDPAGTVTFAGLTPTSGSQVFGIGVATADLPSLYTQLPVTGFALSPTQFYTPVIQVYQPVTLNVALQNQDGSPWVGTASITVTQGSGGTSHTYNATFTSAGTLYTITTLAPPSGQPLLPNYDYFVSISANGFTPVSGDAPVPAAGMYPATVASALAHTFTETMVPLVPPPGELDVTVQMTKSGRHGGTLTCTNPTVVVSGGPQGSQYGNYKSTTGNPAVFANPPDTNIVANVAPYDTTAYTVTATATGGSKSTNSVSVNSSGKTPLTINVGTTSNSSC